MSEGSNTPSTVVAVGRGADAASGSPPRPTDGHRRLGVFIGRWITEGHTAAADGEELPILASDVYQWMPGGFFVIHPAYGRIGETEVGGTEVIGYDEQTGKYFTSFFDSVGNATTSELTCDANGVWRWQGQRTRCTGTFDHDGKRLTAQHERSEDGLNWVPSMLVTLRRID